MNENSVVPTLAPPGAGIPAIERITGLAILTLRRWRGSRERHSREFSSERAAIKALYGSEDNVTLGTRVLIPRIRGLEDSSRYWSVLMTLDHLRIVNTQIAGVIMSLVDGVVPNEKASTAAVKPDPNVGPDVIETYEASCDQLLSVVDSSADLDSRGRYSHPWFGPLNAAGWHAMAAMHMRIHRAQMALIRKELARRSA